MRYTETVEGRTRLLVPATSLKVAVPPRSPVFFNPAASVNRDVSVAIAEACGQGTFCDSLAGVGSRGLRLATETSKAESVTMVDFNSEAIRLARASARLNGVLGRCEFVKCEANSFLFARQGRLDRFGAVDVDPFGSPAGFLQASIAATRNGGVLSVTATDTAALCGVYPKVSRRRYGATSLNNHFHHETALRILVNAVSRRAASADLGIQPVAAHSTRHYLRVFVRLKRGASRADESVGDEGYIAWCPHCGSTSQSKNTPEAKCASCAKPLRAAGPLWLGPLTESSLLRKAAAAAGRLGFRGAEKTLRALESIDRFPPWSYSIERVCSSLKVATVSEADVRGALGKAGFRSCRQPFETNGLKTDAPHEAMVAAVRASVR